MSGSENRQTMIISSLIIMCYIQLCSGQLLEGLYCGRENCYDVLNVTRDHSSSDIRRAYRNLAKIHHPDKYRDVIAKNDAAVRFQLIGNLKRKKNYKKCIFSEENVY